MWRCVLPFSLMLCAATAAGIVGAAVFCEAHPGISSSEAIAAAQRQLPEVRAADLLGVRAGRFDDFWYPGSEDFAAPRDRRVWAVAFRGQFFGNCGPAPFPGMEAHCPPPNTSIMVILDYRDGSFIEGASPVSGFDAR